MLAPWIRLCYFGCIRGLKLGSFKGEKDIDIDVDVDIRRCRWVFWLFKGGFKVVERYRSSCELQVLLKDALSKQMVGVKPS